MSWDALDWSEGAISPNDVRYWDAIAAAIMERGVFYRDFGYGMNGYFGDPSAQMPRMHRLRQFGGRQRSMYDITGSYHGTTLSAIVSNVTAFGRRCCAERTWESPVGFFAWDMERLNWRRHGLYGNAKGLLVEARRMLRSMRYVSVSPADAILMSCLWKVGYGGSPVPSYAEYAPSAAEAFSRASDNLGNGVVLGPEDSASFSFEASLRGTASKQWDPVGHPPEVMPQPEPPTPPAETLIVAQDSWAEVGMRVKPSFMGRAPYDGHSAKVWLVADYTGGMEMQDAQGEWFKLNAQYPPSLPSYKTQRTFELRHGEWQTVERVVLGGAGGYEIGLGDEERVSLFEIGSGAFPPYAAVDGAPRLIEDTGVGTVRKKTYLYAAGSYRCAIAPAKVLVDINDFDFIRYKAI
ncbi:MAG: hypothetical protein FWF84_07300 [Kiritimatiellaeota bacterium]|nr:hypothetical protein [Kiritimatiellota bacterium]